MKTRKKMKKILSIITAAALAVGALTGCGANNAKSPVEGKKTAYIINMPESDIFTNCSASCAETAEKLGMTCDTFFTDGDSNRFRKAIENCAENGYDGLFLSHGGEDYSYELITNLLEKYPKLKIVTFDTIFKDENGETQKIDGVTQIFQDDAGLAESLLDYIVTDIAPEKPAKVLKVWVGDFIAAFDRREIGYKPYEDSGKIQTVETIAPSDLADSATMYDVMKETLSKYNEDEIDAIWVAYDEYARMCYKALTESGKNIPLVSVDLCSADIECMSEENSQWKACAYTDFGANGEQCMRVLALELNNEYRSITDAAGNVSDFIEIPASLVTREELIENGTDVSENNAKEYLVTSDWLVKYIGY